MPNENEAPSVVEEQMEFINNLMPDNPQESENPTVVVEEPDNQDINPVLEAKVDESAPVIDDKAVEVPDSTVVTDPVVTEPTVEDTLRAQIIALTELVNADPLVQSVKADVSGKTTDAPVTDADGLIKYLSDEEVDRLIDEPQLINVALQRAASSMQQSVASLVQAEVNKQIMVTRAVTDFYSANQDLQPYAKFVQFVLADVEKANPTKTYAEIFEETAKESRKRLGLATTAPVVRQSNNGADQLKPAFAGSKRNSGRPAPKGEFFDKNAEELFNLRD
jgi:hypothetical protein